MKASHGVEIIESEFEEGLLQLSNSTETGGAVSVKSVLYSDQLLLVFLLQMEAYTARA